MKPFSKTELKILVYNRVRKGVPYDLAVKQVKEELETVEEIKSFEKAKKKARRTNWKESK